jgi:hypothetical protein
MEKTEIVYGLDNILIQTFNRWNLTKFTIDSYIDKLHPIMLLTIEPIKQGVIELLARGVIGRTITEITEENVPYLKELIRIAGDASTFRHLDNVTGNFSISDGKIYQAQIMGDLSAPSKEQKISAFPLSITGEAEYNHNSKAAVEPHSILSTC